MMTRIKPMFGIIYLFFSLTGAAADCPVEIIPPSLLVKYGESALATCRALVPSTGMGWESIVGAVVEDGGVQEVNWTVKELRDWTVDPLCYLNSAVHDQCLQKLPVRVYQMPESVTLTVSGAGWKYTERSYNLFCRIENFAPAGNVTVKWFKGGTLVKESSEKQDDLDKVGPRNATFEMTTSFSPSDDGTEYHCEVGLDLTPDPVMKSQAVRVTVHYAPLHAWHQEQVLLDADTVLDCTVSANPPPAYEWTYMGQMKKTEKTPTHKATVAGNYTCTASNGHGRSTKLFTVLSRSRGTFWAIIIAGGVVAVLLIVSYTAWKCKAGANSII
ncbi:hypothetical protein ACEWY4_003309 [Coilia grayii]|uniref:Ig-like domain-containing protein n=1 Tax=Coilia grayii TaxID=363190 RepID=A0ABD1KQW7_9TELE